MNAARERRWNNRARRWHARRPGLSRRRRPPRRQSAPSIDATTPSGLEPFSLWCSAGPYQIPTNVGSNTGCCYYAKMRTALGRQLSEAPDPRWPITLALAAASSLSSHAEPLHVATRRRLDTIVLGEGQYRGQHQTVITASTGCNHHGCSCFETETASRIQTLLTNNDINFCTNTRASVSY